MSAVAANRSGIPSRERSGLVYWKVAHVFPRPGQWRNQPNVIGDQSHGQSAAQSAINGVTNRTSSVVSDRSL